MAATRPLLVLLSVVLLPSSALRAQSDATPAVPPRDRGPVRAFALGEVALLEGPFERAQELNRRYLLQHDPDRLLAPFRTDAGLAPKAPNYPNWESMGLNGHTLGHYLTALAQEAAATGDMEWRRRLDRIVQELAECQRANGDGYVGGIPRGRTLWEAVAGGKIDFQNFSLNDAWVPWYNEHKLFAGLRDAWLMAGHAGARDVLIGLAEWCEALVRGLTDEQMQAMLRAEHGGMNEVLADIAMITGDARYLALAERFSHRAILEPLLLHQDKLTGLHANTQIPKIVGFARIAELGGDASWREAARFFWDTVVENRSLAFGGNSEREHFNDPDNFGPVLESREGPETCNTYNMLRLSEVLFRSEPAARYADYYERALFNHILASQHPGHGGFVYFTPIRPRHYRVYSQPEECFWCCVGTGMENHGKYGAFIYAHNDDAVWVNLFIASEVAWTARGVRIRQETQFPDAAGTRLRIRTTKPQRFALHLRHPAWVAKGELAIRVNGKAQAITSSPSSYVSLAREWRDGDEVELDLPMRTTLERLPDGSDYVAALHGPIVLAAPTGTEQLDGLLADSSRMGHVSPGPYLPLDEAPMLVGDPDTLAGHIRPVTGKPLTFTASTLIRPESFRTLELMPLFRLHDARYMLYWRAVTPDRYGEVTAALKAAEQTRLDLEARTVDFVAPGEQQSEVGHQLAFEDSTSGAMHGRQWRDAGGWFSYTMKAEPGSSMQLLVTYYGDESGRSFTILADDRPVATVQLGGGQRDRFIDVAYPLPPDVLSAAADGTLTIKFMAASDTRTARVFGLRLVRTPPVPPPAS